jgi:hypothetical protein
MQKPGDQTVRNRYSYARFLVVRYLPFPEIARPRKGPESAEES